MVKIRRGMIGSWREKAQHSMWPRAVVVGAVLGEDGPQVPFADDQDAVGEFGSGGQYEAFGEAVCFRTARWDLHGVDPVLIGRRLPRCAPSAPEARSNAAT
jgi:hypothetical protein